MGSKRKFDGRTVVVTGAAGGMGRSLARRFGLAGASLALLDRNEQSLMEFHGELDGEGVKCLPVVCDVTDPVACQTAMDSVTRVYGGVDVLINNAGITHFSPMIETTIDTYQKVMGVNFFGAIHCTQAAMDDILKRRGLVIVISSVSGFVPLYHRTGYSASKHALHGFFGSLRAELKGTGVDVLIVCPGFTETGIAENALGGDGKPATEPQSTVGRLASPDSVADSTFTAACRGDDLLVLSAVGKATHLLSRFWPSLYQRIMLRSLRGSSIVDR